MNPCAPPSHLFWWYGPLETIPYDLLCLCGQVSWAEVLSAAQAQAWRETVAWDAYEDDDDVLA